MTLLAALAIVAAQAQSTRVITGKVTDDKGEPLAGATVKVHGTNTTTATDVAGNYTIAVAAGKAAKLDISYIGYKAATVVVPGEGNTPVVVKLTDNAAVMDEIVVIGYGTAKKSALTSSVEVISGEELTRIPAMNVDQSLQGQIAGLGVMQSTGDPSSPKEASMHIRGNHGDPLLVIDGVPRLGTNTSDGEMRLSDLNPDDIESISILKDAAASAVYGARAANGVILVQTKRGNNEGRARINFRGQFNLQEATYLPKFLKAREFAQLYNRAVAERGDDVYKPYDLDAIGSNPNLYADENMLDYLNKWGNSQRYTLSVSGGAKSVRYFVSGGYTSARGLYSNCTRDRFNYAAKLDIDIIAGLSLQVDLSGTISNNKNTSYSTIEGAYSTSPLQVLRYTDGNLASVNSSNPLIAVEGLGGYNKIKNDMHTLNAIMRYKIPHVDGLNVYLKGTMDLNSQNNSSFSKPVPLYLYDEATGTTSVDPNTTYPKAKTSMSDRHQKVDNKLIEFGAAYDHTFAEKHAVTATLIANYQDYNNKYLDATNPELPGEYPEVMGSSAKANIFGSEFYSERASLVGRATYGFANRYFAEFSFRLDGSTRFSPGNRWGFFPTASASWVISNEKFFRKVPANVLSLAKIRASIGVLGDDGAISDFDYLRKYMYSPNYGYPIGDKFSPGVVPSTGSYPNKDLKWGKSKDFNVGLDLGTWGNRISMTVEYYNRTRTNMVMEAPGYLYPPSTGANGATPNINMGKVRYSGVDLSLKHVNTIGKWKYHVQLNLSKTKDKVIDYGDESNQLPNLRRAGGSYMVWTLYEADGLFQSMEEIAAWPVDQDGQGNSTLAPGDIRYKDQDGNGVLTTNDQIYVRNSSYPDFTYGIGLGVDYKGFYLNAQFHGVSGYNQKVNELYNLENGTLQRFQDYHLTDTWTPENPGASYPRIKFTSRTDNNRMQSTFWLRKCNFLRLKALTFGYRVPKKALRRAHISTLDISVQAGNVFTISSLHGMDPESLRGYPLQRTFGLSLNFGL